MSLHVFLTAVVSGNLSQFAKGLEDREDLHQAIAKSTEQALKDYGRGVSAGQHRTANTLGANPAGHLEDAYEGIQSTSSADHAALLIPSHSRLRAAFGSYVLTPKNGSKYLTIPVNKDAYGKRAGEIAGLFFLRVGPNKTPILAHSTGSGLETMYFLTEQVTIPEAPELIPFDVLKAEATDAAQEWIEKQQKQTSSLT